MFGSSRTGFRPVAVSIGVAISLALACFQSMAQSAPEVIPRAANALQLPVAPYIPYKEVLGPSARAVPPASATTALAAGAVTATVAAPTASSVIPPQSTWEVKTSDVTLYRTLERWSQAAGYKLKWDASRNFLIGAPDTYAGTFESALQSVLSSAGIRLSDYPLEACIYANTPPLVRITRQGEQARECSAIE